MGSAPSNACASGSYVIFNLFLAQVGWSRELQDWLVVEKLQKNGALKIQGKIRILCGASTFLLCVFPPYSLYIHILELYNRAYFLVMLRLIVSVWRSLSNAHTRRPFAIDLDSLITLGSCFPQNTSNHIQYTCVISKTKFNLNFSQFFLFRQ